jgi:hypothetical protein
MRTGARLNAFEANHRGKSLLNQSNGCPLTPGGKGQVGGSQAESSGGFPALHDLEWSYLIGPTTFLSLSAITIQLWAGLRSFLLQHEVALAVS